MDFDAAIAELDQLVQTLEADGDERALLLLELIDAIHRPPLELIAKGEIDHPLAQALLGMYDLAPVEDQIQVEAALDEVRPYIHSHGGEVELLGVEDGAVHLQLSGACTGCAGSSMTLKRGIEGILKERYPGFKEIVAHEPEEAAEPEGPKLLQLENNLKLKRPVFAEVAALDDIAPGEMKAVTADDIPVLLLNVQGEIYAFKNGCPIDGMSLEGGRLADTPTDPVLVCPWHNCAFDARSGKRVDGEEGRLQVVPIALQEGAVRVAVNAA